MNKDSKDNFIIFIIVIPIMIVLYILDCMKIISFAKAIMVMVLCILIIMGGIIIVGFFISFFRTAASNTGNGKKLCVISVDTSMDNAYKAIKEYSEHDFKLDYATKVEITMKTWLDIKNGIAIDIRKISPRRCKVFVGAVFIENGMNWVDPSSHVPDIINALNKANYTTH